VAANAQCSARHRGQQQRNDRHLDDARLSANVTNTSVADLRDLSFVAVIFDPAGNAFAASATALQRLDARQTQTSYLPGPRRLPWDWTHRHHSRACARAASHSPITRMISSLQRATDEARAFFPILTGSCWPRRSLFRCLDSYHAIVLRRERFFRETDRMDMRSARRLPPCYDTRL